MKDQLRVPSRRAQLLLLPGVPAPGPPGLSPLDESARGTTFLSLPVHSVLNSPAATGMGFWSLNPYVGCEFGCTYCYARDTHRWTMERKGGQGEPSQDPPVPLSALPAWLAFERRILVKQGVADVLARTLNPKKLAGHSLVIGTATDPYQPAERKFRLTRQILEQLLAYRGLSIGLITKSPLVTRDSALLVRLAERHEVSVNISLATLDARLARRLEPRSPAPRARIRALEVLTGAGVHAGLLVAPIIPGLTDDQAGLSALMQAGKAAGARYVVGSALRLGPAAKARFLPHLEREFPELVERYRRGYGQRDSPSRDYTNALARRLRLLQHRYGFPVAESRRRRQQLEGRQPKEVMSELQSTLL
jgi:DNA repair photolyase